VIPQT